jgi:sulfate transport system permease protein
MQRKIGDVLVSFESEAELIAREFGKRRVRGGLPLAVDPHRVSRRHRDKVVDKKGTRKVAQAYLDYLWSPAGQENAAQNYLRPRNPEILKKYAAQFPARSGPSPSTRCLAAGARLSRRTSRMAAPSTRSISRSETLLPGLLRAALACFQAGTGLMPSIALRQRVLPGFRLSLGCALVYLSLLILLPLSGLVFKASHLSMAEFWAIASGERALASYRVTFGASLLAAGINAFFGLIVAWILVRYSFPGKRAVDALVDLPFALPTAVAGITLATLYAGNGWIGQHLEPLGVKVAFTPLGIVVALTFHRPAFCRSYAAAGDRGHRAGGRGGRRLARSFSPADLFRVLFPAIFPALLTGFTLAFSRSVGEYGSVIFIAGNMPLISEITPLLIISKLEQYDVVGATALAVVMLIISFVMLLAVNALQWWAANRHSGHAGSRASARECAHPAPGQRRAALAAHSAAGSRPRFPLLFLLPCPCWRCLSRPSPAAGKPMSRP